MALNLTVFSVSANLHLFISYDNNMASSMMFGSNTEGGKKSMYGQLERVWQKAK
jgi:hypothetical protein